MERLFKRSAPYSSLVLFCVALFMVHHEMKLHTLDQVMGEILVRLVKKDALVCMEIYDNGPGIPYTTIETIFEPFCTSKPDGNGLGLLSLSLCAQQHNAKVNIGTSHLEGAVFQLCFPETGDITPAS